MLRNVIYYWALAAEHCFTQALRNLRRSAGRVPGRAVTAHTDLIPRDSSRSRLRARDEGGAAASRAASRSQAGTHCPLQPHPGCDEAIGHRRSLFPHIPSSPPHLRACVAAFLPWISWSSVSLPAPQEGDPALLVGLKPCLSHFDVAGRGSRARVAPYKCVKVSFTGPISLGIEWSPVSLSLNPEESKEMKQ